jgi:secretion/DNA translocation related TadE-like protein
MSRDQRDDGSATLWVVVAIAVVVAVATGCAAAGMVVVARHRADTDADAAALAAASEVLDGPAAACAAAAAIARIDGAWLTRCGLDGAGAQVEVSLSLPGGLSRFGRAVGQARAGPAAQ